MKTAHTRAQEASPMHDGSADDRPQPEWHESWQVRGAVPPWSIEQDEELLAALREAIAARSDVPPDFVEAAQNAFAWHNIDYELAQLTFDSSQYAVATRAETASIRALTFKSAHLTIELEILDSSLVGQLIPSHDQPVEIQTTAGATTYATIDEYGCFQITPMPQDQFRLHCRTADGSEVITGWITL
jgi:hypothetical protein